MYWFEPLWLMNHVTVVPMFLVRVEARTPEWFLGWCVGDTRLCTVVFRWGVTWTWYQRSQADCRLPLARVVVSCSIESPDGSQPSLPVRHGYYWSKDNVIGFPSHLCFDSHGIRIQCKIYCTGTWPWAFKPLGKPDILTLLASRGISSFLISSFLWETLVASFLSNPRLVD